MRRGIDSFPLLYLARPSSHLPLTSHSNTVVVTIIVTSDAPELAPARHLFAVFFMPGHADFAIESTTRERESHTRLRPDREGIAIAWREHAANFWAVEKAKEEGRSETGSSDGRYSRSIIYSRVLLREVSRDVYRHVVITSSHSPHLARESTR